MTRPILLARITGVHGLRGAVRLKSFTEDPSAVAAYGPVFDTGGRRFEFVRARAVKAPSAGSVIAEFEGVNDCAAAEALIGTELYIFRDALPDAGLEKDEFYVADLVGLQAVAEADARVLGYVSAVHDFGAGTILELTSADTPTSVMVPFTRASVPHVDIAGRRLSVSPRAAGLEEEPREPQRPNEVPQVSQDEPVPAPRSRRRRKGRKTA